MATPGLPPSDDSSFESMLELDLPKPELPQWAALALAAIAKILPIPPDVAFEALRALIEPLRAMPEGAGKDAVRVAMRAKEREIAAARSAPSAAIAVPAPTERQAIPVVRQPELVAPVVRFGRWVPLMQRGSGLGLQSAAERQRRATVDTWGARVEHAPQEPVTVGTLLRVSRGNGAQDPRVKVVTSVVVTDGLTTVVTVADATPEQQAPRARAVTPPQGIPVGAVDIMSLVEPTSVTTVESSLSAVASEAATLATVEPSARVEPTTRGNGEASTDSGAGIGIFARPASERVFRVGGEQQNRPRATVAERTRLLTERALIAGSVAANGWLQVSWTGEGSTLHGKVNDALMLISREDDAPGVPTGENYAGEAVSEMRSRDYDVKRLPKRDCPDGVDARWIVGRALAAGTTARAGDAYGTTLLIVDLLGDGTLRFDGDMQIATAVRARYATKVAKVTLNSKQLTPWLGKILRTRHGAVKRGHCWYVPPGQAKAVRALIGGSVYADAIEAWANDGGNGPLPKFDDNSIAALWGDHELMSVNTGADLLSSLSNGLRNEVTRIAASFAELTADAKTKASEKAREKASKVFQATEAFITAEGDAAFKRGCVSGTVAARLLRDLGTTAARLSGYSTVLGEGATAGVEAEINALRLQLEPLTDDTAMRGAMIELD